VSVIPYILLANLPQTIISLIYLIYNAQLTTMLAHREWSNYVAKRASLRVTYPSPSQRSTYYLQLPYVFSVPLIFAAVILHWFISQAIFLVRIIAYHDGKPVHMDGVAYSQDGIIYSAVGYSASAFIGGIVWGSALVAAIIAVGFFRRYPIGLPIGGTNSAIISAACHVQPEQKEKGDAFDRPLKWGVTSLGSEEIVGHCSFSSDEVDLPQVGYLYAGY